MAVLYRLMIVRTNLANQHLIDQYPKTPPVYSTGVGCFCQHFWCQKFRCSAESAGPISKPHALFAQTKVSNLEVAFSIQQQVVQLEVPEYKNWSCSVQTGLTTLKMGTL